MLGGSKKGENTDVATLVAESWAELAHSSESFSPYHEYQLAKERGQSKHERQKAYKPVKFQVSKPVTEVVPQQPTADRIEDCQKFGSYNNHHQRAITKLR